MQTVELIVGAIAPGHGGITSIGFTDNLWNRGMVMQTVELIVGAIAPGHGGMKLIRFTDNLLMPYTYISFAHPYHLRFPSPYIYLDNNIFHDRIKM